MIQLLFQKYGTILARIRFLSPLKFKIFYLCKLVWHLDSLWKICNLQLLLFMLHKLLFLDWIAFFVKFLMNFILDYFIDFNWLLIIFIFSHCLSACFENLFILYFLFLLNIFYFKIWDLLLLFIRDSSD
jgi:hypothetical protein